MSRARFSLDRGGVRALLKSSELSEECRGYAETVASVAGAGFVVEPFAGRNRNGYAVKAGDAEAYYRNLKENNLEKGMAAAKK